MPRKLVEYEFPFDMLFVPDSCFITFIGYRDIYNGFKGIEARSQQGNWNKWDIIKNA